MRLFTAQAGFFSVFFSREGIGDWTYLLSDDVSMPETEKEHNCSSGFFATTRGSLLSAALE